MEINDIQEEIEISVLDDDVCLKSFATGINAMDRFIQNDFWMSIKNHYCIAYSVKYRNELIALFALSFDSLDLDVDDKDDLMSGMLPAGFLDMDKEYEETFLGKSHYPALDIAYLAVKENHRKKGMGRLLIDAISQKARSQSFAGCLFLTVDAYVTKDYSAVGFYNRCGFTPSELPNPNKDTLRMYLPLYSEDIIIE